MKAYQTNREGVFVGETVADPSPLEEGVWLVPGGAYLDPPPAFDPGFQQARRVGDEWVVEPLPPPPPASPSDDGPRPLLRSVTPLAFLERLTPDERIAIRRAARQNEGLEDWLDMLRAATEVNLDDPRTVSGLNSMVNAGLLTPARRDDLLA